MWIMNCLPLLKKKVHLKEVRIHLNEFVIVKNKDGEVNLDKLKAVKKEPAEGTARKKETPPPKAQQGKMQIDLLSLKIGKSCLQRLLERRKTIHPRMEH